MSSINNDIQVFFDRKFEGNPIKFIASEAFSSDFAGSLTFVVRYIVCSIFSFLVSGLDVA
jgi:hypothetical protein